MNTTWSAQNVVPASAGMSPWLHMMLYRVGRRPRQRGDEPLGLIVIDYAGMSSPPARG